MVFLVLLDRQFRKPSLPYLCALRKVVLILSAILYPCLSFAADWSTTTPAVNLSHIFQGEINSKGKPVGFHARPHGQNPSQARLKKIMASPNPLGVYTAEVEIFDPVAKSWKEKFSSLFPDQMTQEQVVSAIITAYAQAPNPKQAKWRGPSGLGFTIEGWLCPKGGTPTCPDGAINTAYPIYQK